MKKYIVGILALLNFELAQAYEIDHQTDRMLQDQAQVLEGVLEHENFAFFYLNNFRVRTRLELEVAVPWMAKFNVRPEVELHWSR